MKQILKYLYQNSKNIEIKKLIFDAFNKNKYVREYVAENDNTPIPVLEKLSKDENGWVRYWVAENPNWKNKKQYKIIQELDY